MKQKYILLAFLFILQTFIFCNSYPQSLQTDPNTTQLATQQDTLILPPIRRVGIDTVDTNVDKFRQFMRSQDRLLYGVVALPFNEKDIKIKLSQNLEKQTKHTGRFWELLVTQFLPLLPTNQQEILNPNNEQKLTNYMRKLEIDYHLDAWLKPNVIFSPDETLVRLSLVGIGNSKGKFAREDILLEAQASEDKINQAFADALTKIISTLGHDGRVTYTRDNLMTVDFGTERGLTRGQTINAGYVILTSYHPQSGEFLRAKRVPIYQLKVLESHTGSSLCQVIAMDKIAQNQVEKMYKTTTLITLAWQQNNSDNQPGWHEPYTPDTAPVLGATESGFGVAVETKDSPKIPVTMAEPVSNNEPNTVHEKTPPVNENKNEIQNTDDNDQAPILAYNSKKRSHWDEPGTWALYNFKIGGGTTLGSYAQGAASSFPSTLINTFNLSAFLNVDTDNKLFAKPYAQYTFYNGSLTGQSYYVGATVYNSAWAPQNQGDNIYFGGGIEIDGGSISANSSSKDLGNIAINPSLRFESKLPNFGKYAIEGAFSLFDFIQATPVWALQAEVQPSSFVTKEISFNVGLKRFKKDWIEFSLGVNWSFL